MYRDKKGEVLGIILTILILIILVVCTNSSNNNLSFIENAANKLVNPLQNGLSYIKNKIHGNTAFFIDVNNLKAENQELQKKNNQLEERLREFESIKAENETLKEHLSLSDKYTDYKTISANIISRDISNYSKTIVINVGSKDGIKENMTVIATEGLVGHVVSVSDSTSKVQTIIDSASKTSSIISASRDSVVCKGTLDNNNNLKAVYIPVDATIAQEDAVKTSGLGGIYPKGIYIGKISKVVNTSDLTDRYAIVEAAVNFNKLETVLVITN